MKKIIFSLLFTILFATASFASEFFPDIRVTGTGGPWMDARTYTSLNACVAAVPALTPRMILISDPGILTTGDLTIPSHVTLVLTQYGLIDNVGGHEITFQNPNPIIAPNRRLHIGGGDLDFAVGTVVKSSWFDDLDQALTMLADDTVTLVITESETLTNNCAVPDTVTLRWESPFIITSTGDNLTGLKKIEAGTYQIFSGTAADDFDFLAGSVVHSSWFQDLNDAIEFTENEDVELTILVDQSETIDNDITADEDQSLRIEDGCLVEIETGDTLTINGPFYAGLSYVFNEVGTGAVVFGSNACHKVFSEWWGIDGTDDDVQINAAIDSITAVGGIVELLSKTYLLDTAIIIKSNVWLRGQGLKTIIQVPDVGYNGNQLLTNDTSATAVARTTTALNIKLSDFTVKITTANPWVGTANALGGCIILSRVTGLTISNIYTDSTYNTNYTAIDLWGGNRNVTVEGCRLANADTTTGGAFWIRGGDIAATPAYDSYNITVTNNIFQSDSDEAVAVMGWENIISKVTITGNKIEQDDDLALSIFGSNIAGDVGTATDIVVSGNQIRGCVTLISGASRILFDGNSIISANAGARDTIVLTDAAALAGTYSTDITVSNNYIYNARRFAIHLNGTRINVTGNHIDTALGVSGRGVYVDNDAIYARVTNNYIYNVTNAGVHVNEAANTVIQGNYIYTALNGIYLYGAVSGTVIKNNTIHEISGQGIFFDDAGETITDVIINGNEIVRIGAAMTLGIQVQPGTYTGCEASYNRVEGATNDYSLPTTWMAEGNKQDSLGPKEQITIVGVTLQPWGTSELDSTGAAVNSALRDGSYAGQIKTIVMTEASNSSTVSITNHQTSDPELATFDAVDETGVFMWTGTEWITIFATCTF